VQLTQEFFPFHTGADQDFDLDPLKVGPADESDDEEDDDSDDAMEED
jgi:hypothetical protein